MITYRENSFLLLLQWKREREREVAHINHPEKTVHDSQTLIPWTEEPKMGSQEKESEKYPQYGIQRRIILWEKLRKGQIKRPERETHSDSKIKIN